MLLRHPSRMGREHPLLTHLDDSAPIIATWADRLSRCCWRQFSRFLAYPLTMPPVPASHCLSSLLHAVATA